MSHGPEQIPITIDKKPYKVPAEQNPIGGQALRTLGGVTPEYDLWHRARGREDDELIRPETTFGLEPGDVFYTARSSINPGRDE